MIVDPYRFGSAGLTVDYIGAVAGPTWTDAPIGTPAATREIVVAVRWSRGATPYGNLTSLTIGGVSADVRVFRNAFMYSTGASYISVAIASARVPSGSTGTIAATFSHGVTASLRAYRISALANRTPVATLSIVNSGTTVSGTVSVEAGGILIVENKVTDRVSEPPVMTGYTRKHSALELAPSSWSQGGCVVLPSDDASHALSMPLNDFVSGSGRVWAQVLGVSFAAP